MVSTTGLQITKTKASHSFSFKEKSDRKDNTVYQGQD